MKDWTAMKDSFIKPIWDICRSDSRNHSFGICVDSFSWNKMNLLCRGSGGGVRLVYVVFRDSTEIELCHCNLAAFYRCYL